MQYKGAIGASANCSLHFYTFQVRIYTWQECELSQNPILIASVCRYLLNKIGLSPHMHIEHHLRGVQGMPC